MTKEQLDNTKEIKISQFETVDMSDGLVCDFETGFCGPAEEVENLKQEEKNKE